MRCGVTKKEVDFVETTLRQDRADGGALLLRSWSRGYGTQIPPSSSARLTTWLTVKSIQQNTEEAGRDKKSSFLQS
jgi:hypothetical protein